MSCSDNDIVFDDCIPVDSYLSEIHVAQVRQIYSTLFDRAALAVTHAGLDLDDVLVDRFACLRNKGGDTVRVPVDALQTDATFRQALCLAHARLTGEKAIVSNKWVDRLGVIARRDRKSY